MHKVLLPKLRRIILDLSAHFILTAFISFIIYRKYGNLYYVIIFAVAGIFVDLDHFIDYFLFFKNEFSLKDFLTLAYLKSGKTYIFLHSWELDFLIFIFGLMVKSRVLMLFSLGLTVHLTVDTLPKKNSLLNFLFYRISKKFDARILLPEHFVDER